MSLAPDERKLTSRGKERRDELVRMAITKFSDQGYHPTSVAEIVEGVGVGKGVFYWYFASKEELLRDILADSLLEVRRHQKAAFGDEPNPLRRIELGVRASIEWLTDHAELMKLIDFAWTEETFASDLRKGREISIEDTARHLREAIELGLIEPGDTDTMAVTIRGIAEEVCRVNLDRGTTVDTDAVLRMVMSGISGRGTSPAR